MKSVDIFAAGYAIPLYDISTEKRTWRFMEEEFVLPFGAVTPDVELPGVRFKVAAVEKVHKALGRS